MDAAYEEGAADDVAEGGGNDVAQDGCRGGDVGAFEHAGGQVEHVGYGVFVAEGYECHDGKPAAYTFFNQCFA